ncbi:MAG: hypothetical protein ACR2PZ_06105 [Pseudomonadales bacterium]
MNEDPSDSDAQTQQEAVVRAMQARADDLDELTASRLASIRRSAMALHPENQPKRSLWWPAMGAASAAVVVVAVLLTLTPEQVPGENQWPGDVETLVLIQDLEVIEELEFLAWLDEVENGAG